jgi:hypothetical protein
LICKIEKQKITYRQYQQNESVSVTTTIIIR